MFKEVVSLDCNKVISLGGIDKKTKKPNPTSIEGYYVGNRKVESTKSKSGFCLLHVFQTEDGLTGVWGKTDLDRKLGSVVPGSMARATFMGMKETKNNPMYLFKVEVDGDNTIDVGNIGASSEDTGETAYAEEGEETEAGEDDAAPDETPPARATAPKAAATIPSSSKVKNLLGNRGVRA